MLPELYTLALQKFFAKQQPNYLEGTKTEIGAVKRTLLLFLIFYTSLLGMAQAQTKKMRDEIAKSINHKGLTQLQKTIELQHTKDEAAVVQYLKTNPTVRRVFDYKGSTYILHKIDENGHPLYINSKSNVESGKLIKTDQLYKDGSIGVDISGQNMVVGIWDVGQVRATHELLSGQVTMQPGQSINTVSGNNHMTHVAGTMVGKNIKNQPSARGIAYSANSKNYDSAKDLAEMVDFAKESGLISNHSYGPSNNEGDPVWRFGAYEEDSKDWDSLLVSAPNYLPFIAIGNEQSPTQLIPNPKDTTKTIHINGNWTKGGYDMVVTMSAAKNTMVVGAVNADKSMSDYSNWGPTDDGRVKPEIVARGTGINSAQYYSSDGKTPSDNAYSGDGEASSGTSYAAPAAAAAGLLLQQYYQSLHGTFMQSATLKALMMSTAEDLGNPGPDSKFGWGLVNAEKAGLAIKNRGKLSVIEEITTNPAANSTDELKRTVTASGCEPLVVAIGWLDDPGKEQKEADGIDPTTSRLVYEFDVMVRQVGPNTEFRPWKPVSMANRAGSATICNGWFDLNNNNYKQVYIANPVAGATYEIIIRKKTGSPETARTIALIVTGTGTNLAPTGTLAQTFCAGAKVSDLVATGTAIKWYDAASAGNFLAATTTLTNGTAYYASQTINGCESPRLAVTATVNTTAAPTGAATQTLASGSKISDIVVTGTAIKWYDAATGGNVLAATTALTNGGVYYASQTLSGCEGARLAVTVNFSTTATTPAPTGAATQSFCAGVKVSDLVATGTAIKWYDAASAGNLLAATTALVNGASYYATQTVSGVESTTRLTVTVTVTPNPTVTITGSREICTGGSTSLTASGGTSYSWSGTNFTSTTNPVSISNAGTYTVTATSGNCTASASVSVSVLPSISVTITGNKEICTGGSASLTASGGTSYSWSGPGNFVSTTSVVNVLAVGTYTVTATSGNCTASATISVSVLPSISVTIAGTKEICAGGSTSLTASGGTAYSWSGANFTSTTNPVSISNAGTYTVTAASGNCTASATVSVSVLPSISVAIAGTKEICAGSSTSLTASGGTSYSWSGTNFTSTTNPVNISNAGTYTVTATNGNCTASASVSVAVLPSISVAIAGTKEICAGSSTSLTASGGTSYSWSGPGNFVSTTSVVNVLAVGTYTVTVTSGNCTASASVSVAVLPNIAVSIAGTKEICAGGSTSLTASGSTSYSWSGANFTSTTNPVSISNAGTYTVTATSGNCTASASVSVAVLPSISVAIAGTKEICAGGSTSLTASGGTSYAWSGTNFTSTANSVSISNAGTYTVTATSGNCTASASVSVAVLPSISVVATSNSPVTVGNSIQLSASGGSLFAWSGPANFTSTAQNPTLANASVALAGIYTVKATSSLGCTATATTLVAVQSVTKARSGLADLNLVLDVNNVTPSVGNEIRLAVLVQNSGPDLARNVVAKIKLPQGLAFATNTNIVINDQIARVSFPSITSGTYQLAYVNLKVTSAKYQTIQAEVEDSDQNDPDSNPNNGVGNGEDDQASFLVKVQGSNDTTPDNPTPDNPVLTPKSGSADLSLLLDVNNRTPKVGSEVQVAVYVKNDGPDASTNAILKINLPEGFTFTSGNGFTVNGRTVLRKINRIATGQFELSFFKVRVDAANASKVVVSAEVADADQNDPDSTPGNGIANTEDDRAAVDLSIQPSGSRMGDESITESLIVYPNPTKGLLEVQVVLEEPATVELYLTDISGKTVVKQTLDTVQKQHKTVLDLSNQIQGVYLLSAVSNKTQLSKRIIRIE